MNSQYLGMDMPPDDKNRNFSPVEESNPLSRFLRSGRQTSRKHCPSGHNPNGTRSCPRPGLACRHISYLFHGAFAPGFHQSRLSALLVSVLFKPSLSRVCHGNVALVATIHWLCKNFVKDRPTAGSTFVRAPPLSFGSATEAVKNPA